MPTLTGKLTSVLILLSVIASWQRSNALTPPARGGEQDSLAARIAQGVPFSFSYGGSSSADLLLRSNPHQSTRTLPDGRKLRTTTYLDSVTGLEVSSEVTAVPGSRAVESMLRLRNTGPRNTPVIEKLLPLDLQFSVAGEGEIGLHYAHGSLGNALDFVPVDRGLEIGAPLDLTHYVLRGADMVDGYLPFMNLQWRDGGLIAAVGWTGQWAIHVNREEGRTLRLEVGQQQTHFVLHPGESVRTPSVLLLPWEGADRIVGHNQLRQLLLRYYTPRVNGQIVVTPIGNSDSFTFMYDAIAKKTGNNPLEEVSRLRPGEEATLASLSSDALNAVNEANQLDFIRGIPDVGMELYWLDAGWFEGEWPFGVGNWNADPKKFPRGLKPLADAAHAKGLKFLLWFEPGRVGDGSAIALEHPDWVLHHSQQGKLGGLYDFGNRAALQWMLDLLSRKMEQWSVDIYRQDSNICPLPFWRSSDQPDRQGITENHWVEGLYALWDGLLGRKPGLMIDNANWRITGPDLETMRRTVGSLTRSESECGGIPHPVATQLQTAELSLWIPTAMGTVNGFDPYTFRSAATTGVGAGLDLRASYIPLPQVRQGIAEVKSLRSFWQGDYYPLTAISLDDDAWSAWQFDRSDMGAGYAIFFRRPKSRQSSMTAGLRGISPDGRYEVSLVDGYKPEQKSEMRGTELSRLQISVEAAPGSVLVKYRRTDVPSRPN